MSGQYGFLREVNYLQSSGFTEHELSRLHPCSLRGGRVTYKAVKNYFSDLYNPQGANVAFIERVCFVGFNARRRVCNFDALIAQAVDCWPLDEPFEACRVA